jgi:hypothetical protein
MKTHRLIFITICVITILITTACDFSASTANIKNAYMASELSGQLEETLVFQQNEPFYCVVDLANAPDDTTLVASWYAVNAEGVESNSLIDETEFAHGSGEITFDLTNDSPWPIGTYKVDIYLNGELDQSLEFTVQ